MNAQITERMVESKRALGHSWRRSMEALYRDAGASEPSPGFVRLTALLPVTLCLCPTCCVTLLLPLFLFFNKH